MKQPWQYLKIWEKHCSFTTTQHFHPGRAASFQPGSVINSRGTSREQTTWTLSPSTQGRVTHCWVFKLSVNHQWALKGKKKKRADNWKDIKVTQSAPPIQTQDRRRGETVLLKIPLLRVKFKLNFSAVERKQANTMQWHHFPGVPGILLTTQRLPRDARLHSHPLITNLKEKRKAFPYKYLFVQ